MKKAVIFDLDGTLLNTIEDIADSMNIVLTEAELPAHPIESYKKFVGNGMPKMVERALPKELGNKENVEKYTQKMREVFAENWDKKTKLYPEVDDLLNALQHNRCKMAILSNKPHKFTLETYEKYLSKWSFDVVQGWDASRYPLKPDPKSSFAIAQKLHVNPEEVIFVGDSDVDILTAKNAGFFAIGVSWGFRGPKELQEAGADQVVYSPLEILKFLK
ncbi:HAD family hydrolase [Proteinivorax tanatarense]|uniref:HAD family hydrolase n=1 Tax=Proteinivorax tanatarense TaxID=1260629 RepID=A0AAU7VK99_9FIRM